MRGASDDPELPVLVGKAVESLAALMPPEIAPFVPFGGYLTEVLVRHQQQRWLRWEATLTEAASDVGSPVEELLASLESDPARQELLARVLEASARSIDPAKVRALGRVLSRGLQDDKIDEAFMLAEALGAIEAPHVQLLSTLSRRNTWFRDELDAQVPGGRLVLPGLLSTLSRLGLAESGAETEMRSDPASADLTKLPYVEIQWWITPLGQECLTLLTAAARVNNEGL